jgi:hypothetical protein
MSGDRPIVIRRGRLRPAPIDAEMIATFDEYALALGRVAYASNHFHEQLLELFVVIVEADAIVIRALWYSLDNDRSQRNLVKAALTAAPTNRWLPRLTTAKDDMLTLIKKATNCANSRNDAIHAPTIMATGDYISDMVASPMSGHQRAMNLRRKDLLVEFDWLERAFDTMSDFTEHAVRALRSEHYAWPNKLILPDRRPKKALRDRRPQVPPK